MVRIEPEHRGAVLALAYAPDGRSLFSMGMLRAAREQW